jgi:hypothetical protein
MSNHRSSISSDLREKFKNNIEQENGPKLLNPTSILLFGKTSDKSKIQFEKS